MALGFRMGGAGASTPQPADDKLWIVKDGVVQIPFDDTVYRKNSSHTTGVQWAYSADKLLYRSRLAVNSANASMGTTNVIDFTEYTNLHVVGRAFQTLTWKEKDSNLSSVVGTYYLLIEQTRDSNGKTWVQVHISSAKQDYSQYDAASITVDESTATDNANYSQIKDLWLEKKENLLPPINTLSLTAPSNTASANTTKRTWVKSSFIIGLTGDNVYNTNYISSYSIAGNVLTMTSNYKYGVGFVLNNNVVPNKTYHVYFTSSSSANNIMEAVFYQADGSHISRLDITNSKEFTVPANTEYVVLLATPPYNTSTTFTINGVYEVTN